MKVFISWSGDRSQAMAQGIYTWLPKVIESVEPWLSTSDIEIGSCWEDDMAVQLEKTDFGIICFTAENLDSNWIHYEAGALSKALQKAHVCPYILDIEPEDIKSPLKRFQATKADKEGTRRLINTINRAQGAASLPEPRISDLFEAFWPRLEQSLRLARKQPKQTRTEREMVAEIVDWVHAQPSPEFLKTLESKMNLLSEARFEKIHRMHDAGLVDVRPNMSPDLEAGLGKASQEVLILQTWIPDVIGIKNQLREALARGSRIRILLLEPSSESAATRSTEVGFTEQGMVRDLIKVNIDEITKLCEEEPSFAERVELRLYNGTPVLTLYVSDDIYILGLFWRGVRAVEGPQFVIKGGDSYIVRILAQHFENIWESATRHPILIKK